MKISKEAFQKASIGLISNEQVETIWKALEENDQVRPQFDLANIAYYFGAMTVISAMGWFMTRAWEQFGGGGIFVISAIYAICFNLAGRTLWKKEHLKIPGGLLFTMAVSMTPLAIYGIERLAGIWPQGDPGAYPGYHIWVKGSWFLLEVGTMIVGIITLWFIRFPFLMAPVAFSLWYMSMDMTPLLFGQSDFSWNQRLWVSLYFGLAMLLVSYFIDNRTKKDFAFWLYLFGMTAFWGGLSLMENQGELQKFLYCLINIGLVVVSVLLDRRVFIIFGSVGVFGYLGHLAQRVFNDSLMFPFVLTLMGILIIYLGTLYQRNRQSIENAVLGFIPDRLRKLLPKERT
ncbi:MAG: DUF2157 domain-containing protein [Nitrospirae bacterium]|nr:DUF2157 domain-containing protein [Nitrospirota bacterium]MBI3594983.1 DUF2157 domain-containing protein [Nitrospirota bacterium]